MVEDMGEKQIMIKGWKNFMKLSSPQDSIYPMAYLHKRQRAVLSHLVGSRAVLVCVTWTMSTTPARGHLGVNPPIASPVGFMPTS